MLWLLVATPVLLYAVDLFFMNGKLLLERCEKYDIYLSLTSNARFCAILLTVCAIPFLLALGFAIFFTSQDDSFIESIVYADSPIWKHAQVCYADPLRSSPRCSSTCRVCVPLSTA